MSEQSEQPTDHYAEAEKAIRNFDQPRAIAHALIAIADQLFEIHERIAEGGLG